MGEICRFPIMTNLLCNTVKYFQSLFSDRASNLLTGAQQKAAICIKVRKKRRFNVYLYDKAQRAVLFHGSTGEWFRSAFHEGVYGIIYLMSNPCHRRAS